MSFLRTDDSEIFYTVTGTGTPLVLVHGWTADSVDYSWLIPLLKDDFRVIAYDLRGLGRSAPAAEHGMDRQLADLAAIITQVAGEPALLVGHSLGAAIVSSMAVEYPDLTLGIVALDGPYAAEEQLRPRQEGLRKELVDENAREATQAYFGRFCFHDRTPDWLRTLVLRRVESLSPAVIHDNYAALWDHLDIAYQPQSDGYLARRACPVLVIHKNAQKAAYEEGTFRHPASRVIVMAEIGHWLQIERPHEVGTAIREWWSTVRTG